MFFFASEIKNVSYGWVRGKCLKGDLLETSEKWLAQYCGFFPPLWLSSDYNSLFGYSHDSNKVLFGFKKLTKIFPVSYQMWMYVMGILANYDINNQKEMEIEIDRGLWDLKIQGVKELNDYCHLETFLRNKIFIKKDQIITDAIDLRRNSIIICKDESQRYALSKKGFSLGLSKVIPSFLRCEKQ